MTRKERADEYRQRAYAHANGDYGWLVLCRFKMPMWKRTFRKTTWNVTGFGMSQPKVKR